MNPSDKLSICLFSDANFLAVNLLENLLSKNCVVNILTNDTKNWTEKTSHLTTKNKFSILERRNFESGSNYDYAVFCGGFIQSGTAYTDYVSFNALTNPIGCKTVAIFPFEIFNRSRIDSVRFSENTALILVGDLLGPRINLESDLLMPRVLSEIISKRKISLGVGEVFYPVFVSDAVKVLAKWLFSFGPYGKATLLLGSEISSDTFWNNNRQLVGQLVLKNNPKIRTRILPRGPDVEVIKTDLNFSLTETYAWLSRNKLGHQSNKMPAVMKHPIASSVPQSPRSKNFFAFNNGLGDRGNLRTGIENIRPKIKIKSPKGLRIALIVLLLVLVFPFLTLLASLVASLVAYKCLMTGKDNLAQSSLLLAGTFAVISEKGSQALSYIPGAGLVYKETDFAASFGEQADNIGIHAIPVIKDAAQLFKNTLASQVYNPTNLSQKLESGTGILYNDVSSIKTFTDNAALKNVILAKKILTKIDFEGLVNLVSECKVLAVSIPSLLGQDQSKTYLVLFENNMELRPTGGFIGSFGLLSFDGGRLTDLAVNDVYSADGQLNGHVEPPAPIKNYLGEANWWLRDSNWDPDFPTSAKRAEWFLDKEIGKSVDGVMAVDLSPIKEILKITGPIFLSDYNMNITSDNLYEETQSEVQNNFFPGTHQKASFITALSRTLLDKVAKLKTNQLLVVLKSFYDSLNQRHIQVYLHDNGSQEAIAALHWDGGVSLPSCGSACYGDLVGIVEANVGDNKANFFIQRTTGLQVTVGAYEIDRTISLNLKNTANPALGASAKYKTYIRLLIPEDAVLTSVGSYIGETMQELSPEITDVRGHKEVGVLVEVLGGGSKQVQFSWSTSVNTNSPLTGYGLYFRKQAGTEADPASITIKGNGVQINPDPRFGLTRDGSYVYNTTLAQDLYSLFSW